MRRLLVGIVAGILVIGTGAYFGWDLLAQFRTKSQVEQVFDSLRMAFPTASHGRVELFTKSRAIRISNIILQSSDRATTIKIEQMVAINTRGPVAGRVSAGRIELRNWELTTTLPIASGPVVSYKAPSVVIETFTGPPSFPQKVNTASMIDVVRASLEYFSASTASAITIPKLTVNLMTGKSAEPSTAFGTAEYTYYELALREIGNGHIGTITTARTTFTNVPSAPETGSFAGAMAQASLTDLDVGAVLAMFDPSNSKTDNYLQVYKQASAGPIEIRFSRGPSFQVDGFSVEDIAVRPLKFSIFSFLAMAESAPKPGQLPTPAQTRAVMEQVANIYEGIRIGKWEMRGIKVRILPDVDFKMDAFRLTGLENGRLAEFALEGIDGKSPQKEPVHIGRIAFKGLQMASLARQVSQLAESAGLTPSPDQMAGLLSLLEGIEISDVVASTGQQKVRIDSFRLSWGQFVGPIPTNVRLFAKTSVPTNLADIGTGGMLSGTTGMSMLTTSVDLGVVWTEATQTLDVSPATIELADAFSFTAKLSIRNVPRTLFTTDKNLAMAAAEQLEAGPIELSLRDTGGVKTALTQYAKGKGLSEDDARKQIIDSLNDAVKASAQSNPDLLAVGDSLAQFIEKPGSTFTITVTPKGKVNFKKVFEAASADPAATTSLFTIEAKTTR